MHVLDKAFLAVRADCDLACTEAAAASARNTASKLNECLRRFRHYSGEEQWISILLESAEPYAPETALLTLHGNGDETTVRLRAQRDLAVETPCEFRLSSASAFSETVTSRDPVVALRSASEVSPSLAHPDLRAHLFPIVNAERVVAVLFASGPEQVEFHALELIANFSGMALARDSNRHLHHQLETSNPQIPPETSPAKNEPRAHLSAELPPWFHLPEAVQRQHRQAQRFARLAIARLQLARPADFRAGKEQNSLYLFLRNELEPVRNEYRNRFLSAPAMVDYLHLELVRVGADGDDTTLGGDYPGPLIP